MNFLAIVKLVRSLSGMQGTGPSSVVGTTGIDTVIVQMVQATYRDIQVSREGAWPWLIKKQSFTTTAGKHEYSLSDIFQSATNDLKEYKPQSVIIDNGTKKSYLMEIDEDVMEYKFLNSDAIGQPSSYSINYTDYSLELRDIPDASYTVTFDYHQLPQELTLDNDVPLMPPAFHDLMVYKALERLSIYLSTPEIFQGYQVETNRMMGNLMRGTLKPKRILTRPLA